MLNPPTRRVGGTAKGPYADQAALIDIARRQGIYDPGFIEIMAATGELGDVLFDSTGYGVEPTDVEQLAPFLGDITQEELYESTSKAISEGNIEKAKFYGGLTSYATPSS
jgi:hypothetical protein